jgi:hypothetical protein
MSVGRGVEIINPNAAARVQSELASDENLMWAGVPNPRAIFHSDDWILILWSLLLCGFMIYWEGSVSRYWQVHRTPNSLLLAIFGFPFVLLLQYPVWIRFLVDAWRKRRTYYAVTDRRVLIVQEAWKRKTRSLYHSIRPVMERQRGSRGTLWLGPKLPLFGARSAPKRDVSRFKLNQRVAVLADIDGVEFVYRLIRELGAEERKAMNEDP